MGSNRSGSEIFDFMKKAGVEVREYGDPLRQFWDINNRWHEKALVVDGKAESVMCSYNSVRGQPACGNEELPGEALAEGGGTGGAAVAVTYQSVAVRRANAANTDSTISARANLGFMVREPTAAL
jgi:hypothetical protein